MRFGNLRRRRWIRSPRVQLGLGVVFVLVMALSSSGLLGLARGAPAPPTPQLDPAAPLTDLAPPQPVVDVRPEEAPDQRLKQLGLDAAPAVNTLAQPDDAAANPQARGAPSESTLSTPDTAAANPQARGADSSARQAPPGLLLDPVNPPQWTQPLAGPQGRPAPPDPFTPPPMVVDPAR